MRVIQPWFTDPLFLGVLAAVMIGGATIGFLMARPKRGRVLAAFSGALATSIGSLIVGARFHSGWQYSGQEPTPLVLMIEAAGIWVFLPLALLVGSMVIFSLGTGVGASRPKRR